MKLTFKTAVVAFVAFTALLSSCSTSLEVTKRQHRSGYHVSLNKKDKTQEQEHVAVTAESSTKTTAANEITVEPKIATFANEKADETLTNETVAANSTKKEAKEKASEFKKPSVLASIKAVKKAKKQLRKLKQNEGFKAADDTDLLILILLAVLLPWIAVLLVENMELTNRFWISVLLWLLFVVPGIVYALLVIFGKV